MTRTHAYPPVSTLWRRLLFLAVLLGVSMGMGLLGSGCGPGVPLTITIQEPVQDTVLKGLVPIRVTINPGAELKRLLVAVRYQGEPAIWKVVQRIDSPSTNELTIDWDTTSEKDGIYQIEVEALHQDGRAFGKKTGNIWVVNKTATLVIPACASQPVVVKDKLTVKLEWADALAQVPNTTVELFVQGKSIGKESKAPYEFEVDLTSFENGQEISLNAVAIRGVYSGASVVCSVLVDREGPRVQFVSPNEQTKTVPANFAASIEVEEEFGVKEVRILADGKVVGTLASPPFQVPVDLSQFQHGTTVTLSAVAVDRAGNETAKPPTIKVEVDSKPPIVKILSPQDNSRHVGPILFEASVEDESGIELIDFYIIDESGNRLDNILHVTGAQAKNGTYKASMSDALSQYGPGVRSFEVVVRDIRGNITTQSVKMIFGCREDADCPTQSPVLKCLGNRCLVPRRLGDQCSLSQGCEPPLVCHFGGLSYCSDQKIGFCRNSCSGGVPCLPGYFCLSDGKTAPVCFPGDPCDPSTSNCTPTSQCTPWGANSFVCLPIGKRKAGQSCSPFTCADTNNCIKDHVCVPNGSVGQCHRVCDTDFPDRDCASGETCLPFPLRDSAQNTSGYCQ
jgi:hypothetical protein